MKGSRFFLSFLSVSVLHWILSVAASGILLKVGYQTLESVSKESMNMVLFPVQSLIYGVLFVALFCRGFDRSKSRVRQGLVFGFLMGALISLPASIASYATYSFYTFSLASAEAASTVVISTVLGGLVGSMYK